MKPQTLQQIAEWSGATLVRGNPELCVAAVTTDTRKIKPGEMLVALRGEKFDAHDFLAEAVGKGASAVLIEKDPGSDTTGSAAVLLVNDSLLGLQNLARGYRLALQPRVIGVTGSAGKTSTKDMLSAVLRRKFVTAATPGNWNNHIGVPLTLLSLSAETELLVCEMGMNHPGEIQVLVDIAQPDAAVITNIGTAHIEYMGSRAAIAEEKGTLAAGIPAEGFVVLNADDDFTSTIAQRCQARVITAGMAGGNLTGSIREMTTEGSRITLQFEGKETETFLPVPGAHMVRNALLAVAAGIGYGIDWIEAAQALRDLNLTSGRLQRKQINGVMFLDDSYNANPESMAAALETLQTLPAHGRRIAVLGKMGELGDHAEREHEMLGRRVAAAGIPILCTVGPETKRTGENAAPSEWHHFDRHETCAAFLQDTLCPGDVVLVKGSRAAGMEQIIKLYSPLS